MVLFTADEIRQRYRRPAGRLGAAVLVAVVLALHRCHRESSGVDAIIVDHMVSPNPYELVALVNAQLRHRGLVPPEPLLAATAALAGEIRGGDGGGAFTGVDLEAGVGGDERSVAPIGLDSAALRGPIVGVPYRAVNAHGLVGGERNAFGFKI